MFVCLSEKPLDAQGHEKQEETNWNLSQFHILYVHTLFHHKAGCIPQVFMIIYGITTPSLASVFLTWLCVWETCWAGGAGSRRPGLGWRRRWTSSPEHLRRMGSDRRRCRSRWGSGPLCSSWPAASTRSQSWTGGRLGRRGSAAWRYPGWAAEGKNRGHWEGG